MTQFYSGVHKQDAVGIPLMGTIPLQNVLSRADTVPMSSPFMALDQRLRHLPDVAIFAMGMAALACLTAFKLTAGRSVPLIDFFLIPTAAVAWLSHTRWSGLAAAAITAIISALLAMEAQGTAAGPAVAAAAARFVLYAMILFALGAMRRMQSERETEARTDPQTGAANARGFREVAERDLAQSRRSGESLSLLYFDIDGFKDINDRFGHTAGDHVLLHVSHVLRATVRSVDTVARLGGDEFAVLVPGADATAARQMADRLRVQLARVRCDDASPISCSVGLATFVSPPATVEGMLAQGDALMYRAKAKGKGRVEHERVGTRAVLRHAELAPTG